MQLKTQKKRQEELISNHPANQIKDSFKLVLTKTQPKDAAKIVDVLPSASPKRLKRMIESIPTPKSDTEFTDEDALALSLNINLSRNKYDQLRKALIEKGWGSMPSTYSLNAAKENMLPPISEISDKGAGVSLSHLLENTASRIISTFSKEEIDICKNSEVTLICKWGCDGSSGFSEYKQQSESNTKFSTVLMASIVPLRMRLYKESSSSSSTFQDVWINSTPGSKLLCRPIRFEYTKEDTETTNKLVGGINTEYENLSPISVVISGSVIKVSFQLNLTMIDGKVANAITDTKSNWQCNICGKKNSEFQETSDEPPNNENALKYGISPLHARIRFMEYCLHLGYDNKYRSSPGNMNIAVKNNTDLHDMRKEEKTRIQNEFKKQGLIIDKPLHGYGSSNDGNTARRFFEDPETTSEITGLDKNLIRRFKIILSVINCKKPINAEKFKSFTDETQTLIWTLYPWKPITPTVHKVLSHGKDIIENSILPLGELTEEAQEARNRDVKQYRLFKTRKCSKLAQNSDLMQHLLLSSDPVLYNIRTKWLPKICTEIEKDDTEATEINNLLSFDILDCFVENK